MKKLFTNKYTKLIFWAVMSATIEAIALTTFTVPGQIYPSGVTGLSRLASDLLEKYLSFNLSYYYIYAVINIILAIIVFKYIGKLFTIFSLIQVLLVSFFASIFKPIITVDNVLLLSIFGGIVNGFAVGLALSHNISSGGFDFLSIYFSDKYNKSMWNYILALNCLVVCTAGIIFGWERAMYSIIFQFVSTTIVNKMHKRYTHQTLLIITKIPEEVSKAMLGSVRHGITKLKAEGEYKHETQYILYSVINTYQKPQVVSAIRKTDPNAFICVSDDKEVIGNYYRKPLD